MPVGEVYVHHTAGVDPIDKPTVDAAKAFYTMNESAIVNKGYSATDYSMLVHTSAGRVTTIGEARGQWTPAATLDRNRVSKAVCLMGYFHPADPAAPWTGNASRHPLPQELEAIACAIVWMIGNGWVRRDAIIRGHRDNPAHLGATGCPGDYLYAELPTIRQHVARLLGAPTPTPPPTPAPTPPPIPAPPEEAQTMVVALDENGTAWIGDGMTRFAIADEATFNNYVVLANSGVYRLVNTSGGGVRGWPDVRVIDADTLEALGRA